MKKRNKDLDWIYDNMALNVGIAGGTHVVGKLGSSLPSPTSDKIMGGMSMLYVVPTVHAMGGIFGQLQGLEKQIKKKR